MSDVIAEETTTLPEGAQISVYKSRTVYKRGTVAVSTYLSAYHSEPYVKGKKKATKVKMLVEDNISAANLKSYLHFMVKAIVRRRIVLTKKPEWLPNRGPKDIGEFVLVMAHKGMFMLDDSTTTPTTLQGNGKV